ncbi:MAG: shikimate kinase [Candidatus Hydrogenedentota bacterium]
MAGEDKAGGNVALIGMPGAGKSTVGVLLAKALGMGFLDTDVLLQARAGRTLPEIIEAEGPTAFLETEAGCVRELAVRGHVIATGGSVVLNTSAMNHLSAISTIVYLEVALEVLRERFENPVSRGVVRRRGQGLAALYAERLPYYRHYAGATVDCSHLSHTEAVAAVRACLHSASG